MNFTTVPIIQVLAFAIALNVAALILAYDAQGQDGCTEASARLKEEAALIQTLLPHYQNCVSRVDPKDDCSNEFRELLSVQFDFEAAVMEKQRACESK